MIALSLALIAINAQTGSLEHLSEEPIVGYVFGGGKQAIPDREKISRAVLKLGTGTGWKDMSDGGLVYTSPKKLSYIFLSSLYEIRHWKALSYCRKKVEQSGMWTIFSYSELPDSLQTRLSDAFPQFAFSDNTSVTIGIDLNANVSGSGRTIQIPIPLSQPDSYHGPDRTKYKANQDLAKMIPVSIRSQLGNTEKADLWRPLYQVWNLNVMFDSRQSDAIQDALKLLGDEINRRSQEEEKAFFKLLKDNQRFLWLQSQVGQPINFGADQRKDPNGWSLANNLNARRAGLGFNGNLDWQNFSQQAKVESLSTGFTVGFAVPGKQGKQTKMSLQL